MAVVIYRTADEVVELPPECRKYFVRAFRADWLPLVSLTGTDDRAFFDLVCSAIGRDGVVHRTHGRTLSPSETRTRAKERWSQETGSAEAVFGLSLQSDLLDIYLLRRPGVISMGSWTAVVLDTVVDQFFQWRGLEAMELLEDDLACAPWEVDQPALDQYFQQTAPVPEET